MGSEVHNVGDAGGNPFRGVPPRARLDNGVPAAAPVPWTASCSTTAMARKRAASGARARARGHPLGLVIVEVSWEHGWKSGIPMPKKIHPSESKFIHSGQNLAEWRYSYDQPSII